VAFALVQVGDLLGADIGPRGRDRMETRVGQSSGEQGGIRRAWWVVQTEEYEYLSRDLI